MVWCLLSVAVAFAGLGAAALTFDLRRLRPPRTSPRALLRGCLAGSLIVVAGLLVALAAAVLPWVR